ncbi:unnamed protein product [Caenorhabditis auriculariae]|uniref:MD-2-related lipid-recognition domain-containing protein n=1 Tax=Caenorhabditis auriculariae TaxID=2777116 RepID=A0A8S1H337_9PELO|nr:unnamed protein product [Caenorhabditis auriculariae]
MLGAVLFLLTVVGSATACQTWPNSTETATNWWMCSSGPMTFSAVTTVDCKGVFEYPIHLNKPLLIRTTANNAKNVYSSPGLKQTIKVWSWSTIKCAWTSLPTFGLLNDLDACTNGVNCPIKLGPQTLDFELDFSDAQQIINLLKNDSPYQLEYLLHDDVTGDDACLMFQARSLLQ